MKMLPLLLAGTVVVVAGVVAYQSHQHNQQLQQALHDAQFRRDLDNAEAATRHSQLQDTINALRRDIGALQQQLAAAQTGTTSGIAAPNQPPQSAATTPAGSIRSITPANINAPENRAVLDEMMLNSEYGEFIAALKLPPDARKQLTDLILDVFAKRHGLYDRVMRGEISREQQQAAVKDDLAKALAGYLSAEEMEVFHDFEVTRPERNRTRMASSTRMMLEMSYPGLTADTRQLVADTWTAAMTNLPYTTNGQAVSAANIEEAYQQTELFLQSKLEPDQMDMVRQYFAKQRGTTRQLNQ